MKVAIYARVSTNDKDQDPETQLMPLRDFCNAQGWEVYREYADKVSALDVAYRTAWRELLDDAAKRRFKAGAGLQAGPCVPLGEAYARHLGRVGSAWDSIPEPERAV